MRVHKLILRDTLFNVVKDMWDDVLSRKDIHSVLTKMLSALFKKGRHHLFSEDDQFEMTEMYHNVELSVLAMSRLRGFSRLG